jgi:putative endonuclease
MARKRRLFVYIMTNRWRTVLYTGVTNNLERRVWQHRNPAKANFTSRYNVDRLVWFDYSDDPMTAITREKQIKAGSRQHKVGLIEAANPTWRDLSEDF